MTWRAAFTLVVLLSFAVSVNAEVHGVDFAPSPAPEWRCGLASDDFPGLAAEHMTQPLAAGWSVVTASGRRPAGDAAPAR